MVATADAPQPHAELMLDPQQEALAARVARAAYEVALRHPHGRPFTELELNLWREIRGIFREAGVDVPEVT